MRPGLSNAEMTAMTLNLSQESGRGPPGVYAWCTKLQPLSTTLPAVMVTSRQQVTIQRERPIANMWLSRWASANSRQPVFRKIRVREDFQETTTDVNRKINQKRK